MPRDLDYENNNIAYDPQYPLEEGGGIKCKNYELCKTVLPRWWFDCKGSYLCINCLIFGWGELEFKYQEEECCVCNETVNIMLKFPTSCGHWFCCECSRNILLWDETRYHLSQVPYGCPPCPNGCLNPEKGTQCNCIKHDEIKDVWEKEFPQEFERWNEDDDFSINNTVDYHFANRKCPLCRSIYK
jgi:hypothetical protein